MVTQLLSLLMSDTEGDPFLVHLPVSLDGAKHSLR